MVTFLKYSNVMSEKNKEEIINPIDPDKIAENPHLLPYAHTVGGFVIKPIDKGRAKGVAVKAMYEQTDIQLDQIRQQIELLAQQAKAIQNRVAISEQIYLSDMNFEPVMGKAYHLYKKKDGSYLLSMISPAEWGKRQPYEFIATVKLMADHTWEVLENG